MLIISTNTTLFKYLLSIYLSLNVCFKPPEYKVSYELLELAYIISAECLICDDLEKEMVANVVINRMYSPEFPKTIKKVIQEDNQFHAYCSEWYTYDKRCHEIAVTSFLNRKYKDIVYFWKGKKPPYVKKIIYKQKHHNFGI